MLTRDPDHIRLPGQSRPVVMAEPVAMEDAVEAAVRLVEHWRQIARSAPAWRVAEHLDAHTMPWPGLRKAVRGACEIRKALEAKDADWSRRRSRAAEEVLASLLGWDQRTVHRRRGDYENFLRVNLRLATCEDCGQDIFRERTEPKAPRLCALCRERQRCDFFLRLEGWLPRTG